MTTTDQPLLPVLADTGSVLRREALACGFSQEEIQRLVDHGAWVRIRRGAYALGDVWRSMNAERRHAVTARAVVRSLDGTAVLGHTSAAIAHGLPVWGVDLSSVHVVRGLNRHGSRREAGVVHHVSQLPDGHITEIDGVQVTTAARTVVDLARTVGFEPAVATMDAALHAGLVTPDDLLELLTWQLDWPGSRAAGRAVAFADGRAESVAESRGRVRMAEAGLPTPDLQVNIHDDTGQLVGRGDMVFREQHTIGECDGRLKYRAATAGRPLEDVLWDEKRREDSLRALGWEVVRFTWADLERSPAWLRQMFLAAFARASGRPAPSGFTRATRLTVG